MFPLSPFPALQPQFQAHGHLVRERAQGADADGELAQRLPDSSLQERRPWSE